MRAATFNILHGRTIGDGVNPQRLRDCVRRLDPDVLALLEVDFEQPRSDRADLTAAASWQVVRLPRIPMRFPMYLPGPNRVMVVNEEPRAAVIAQLHTPLGGLTVANTHLSFVPGWNRRQLSQLVHDLRGIPGPRLLTGDLNMTPRAVRRWSGMRALAVAPTFPAETPERQLDHILTDDHRLRGGAVEAELMPISDHRPLVVNLAHADIDRA